MSIGIALLGAGIFARGAHVPAIKACSHLSLKAVYSRSKSSADRLVHLPELAGDDIDTYYDAASGTGRSLGALLERDDIDAVIIALPIPIQPYAIKKAIEAGKHVLSEKPIAKDVSTAEKMLQWYGNIPQPIWAVGENFRFMDHINCAYKEIQDMDGEILTFSTKIHAFMGEDDEYAQTEWRKDPQYQGGFLLDAGVHYVAAIRYLLSAASTHLTSLSAFTSLLQPHLAPLDTITSIQRLSNGHSGTFSLTFSTEFSSSFAFEIITDRGSVAVTSTAVKVQHNEDVPLVKRNPTHTFKGDFVFCVKHEVATFAKMVLSGGKRDWRMSPKEALEDLRVVQAMLESGEERGAVKHLTQVNMNGVGRYE